MKNKKILYGIVFIIVVGLLYKGKGFISTSSNTDSLSQKEKDGQVQNKVPADMPNFKEAEAQYLNTVKTSATPDLSQMDHPLDVQSEQKLKEFKQIARLDFSPPAKMRFMKLDLSDDGVEGTYGKAQDGKSGMAVLATAQLLGTEAAKNFLQTSSEEIPSLKNKNVDWNEKVEMFPAPPNSGLNEAKVWTGVDANGNSYAAALITRQDRKGTYFFIYNTQGRGVFNNDGYFDKVFSEIKVLDP